MYYRAIQRVFSAMDKLVVVRHIHCKVKQTILKIYIVSSVDFCHACYIFYLIALLKINLHTRYRCAFLRSIQSGCVTYCSHATVRLNLKSQRMLKQACMYRVQSMQKLQTTHKQYDYIDRVWQIAQWEKRRKTLRVRVATPSAPCLYILRIVLVKCILWTLQVVKIKKHQAQLVYALMKRRKLICHLHSQAGSYCSQWLFQRAVNRPLELILEVQSLRTISKIL